MKRFLTSLAAVVSVLLSVDQKTAVAAPGDLLLTFPNPTGEHGDWFGSSITAVGKNVLFGVGYDDTGFEDAGVAYLFDGGTAAPLHTFLNPDAHIGDQFGRSVAAVGNNVIVGAPSSNYVAVPQPGTAYLFEFSDLTDEWSLKQTFLNPSPNPGDGFGYSIAAIGNNVLISAPNDDTRGGNAGAAYLFDTSGNLVHTFFCPVSDGGHYFGSSVAAIGDNILIGAGGSGIAVYSFEFNHSTDDWELLRTFANPMPPGGRFGQSVAAVGNNVLVGACYRETAYMFDGETAKQIYTLREPTPVEDGMFGISVAAVADNALVGGYYEHADGFRAGAAYLFDGSTGKLLTAFETDADDIVDVNVAAFGNHILIGGGSSGYMFEGIPEPSTLVLLSMAAVGLLAYAWRRRRSG